MTPLHLAVRNKHIGIAGWLIDHGAKPDVKDKAGNTALDLAMGDKDMLKVLGTTAAPSSVLPARALGGARASADGTVPSNSRAAASSIPSVVAAAGGVAASAANSRFSVPSISGGGAPPSLTSVPPPSSRGGAVSVQRARPGSAAAAPSSTRGGPLAKASSGSQSVLDSIQPTRGDQCNHV